MPAASTIENEYVSQKIFDLRLDNIEYRANTDRERVDDRIEKNQAVVDKNMAEVKAMFAEIQAEIKLVDQKVDLKIDRLDEKFTILIQGTNERIDGLEKRFDDMKESQNKWFTVFGILFTAAAIVAPVAVAVVQHFMNK